MDAGHHRGLWIAIVWLVCASPVRAQDHARPSLDFLEVPERARSGASAIEPAEAAALEEIGVELTRFDASARAYRRSIDRIVRRRLEARRRGLSERYDRAIRVERGLEERERERTRAELIEFVRRHPDDGEHTADAMLRLAELHALAALDAVDRGEVDRPDFTDAVAVAQRLVERYPRYRHLDRALYLLGHALSEMDRSEEALAAWRALACANRFPFGAPLPAAPDVAPAHPAFTAERPGGPDIGADPYVGCTPAMSSDVLAEVWLRIGEHHFDGTNDELAAAIGAYRRVVEDVADPLYSFGLYKLAWSEYRASHYADAIATFEELLDYSDARRARTGRAGSDLRAEAIQYIAITFAYEDWDENGTSDVSEGGPTSLDWLSDRDLLPDRPWTHEVLRAAGDALFEQARSPEAIDAWRAAMARAPRACGHPEILLSIARAAPARRARAGDHRAR